MFEITVFCWGTSAVSYRMLLASALSLLVSLKYFSVSSGHPSDTHSLKAAQTAQLSLQWLAKLQQNNKTRSKLLTTAAAVEQQLPVIVYWKVSSEKPCWAAADRRGLVFTPQTLTTAFQWRKYFAVVNSNIKQHQHLTGFSFFKKYNENCKEVKAFMHTCQTRHKNSFLKKKWR